MKRGATTDAAGILIHPFSNKKVAQTSLGINLKTWKISKPKYTRGWYRAMSTLPNSQRFSQRLVGECRHS